VVGAPRTQALPQREHDPATYPDKIAVTDRELAAVQLEPHPFHPEWNYTIQPRP